ncbi:MULTISPECIES: sucrase ferredoxin [unclassified Streptomyces]|uniref:sucrase ferredoxin n=1 Tax=unclassified Streptomyces TaxID=2593676 RepID=UPI0013714EE4|nr:sucrase ferredoxin [Streptomyces sp. YIM 132580]
MTTTGRFFCADAARARGDSMVGTAPHGTAWVLIEYRGGWPANGFDGLALEPGTKALVFAAAQAARARVLLVRRHGRQQHQGPPRWAVLRYDGTGAHRQRWGTWDRDEELTQIVQALDTPDLNAPAFGTASLDAPEEWGGRPVVLVCAHGLHDACCAVRGRPVGRALSERWPELVWECTHVGGDRFAANVVVVPDGVYYGNLDAGSSVAVVGEHLAGRVRAEHLRGYTDLFPPQQAAVAAVLDRFGPAGRHDYAVARTLRDEDGWQIRVTGRPPGPAAVDVEVRARRTPQNRLTCRGPATSSAVVYDAVSIRPA